MKSIEYRIGDLVETKGLFKDSVVKVKTLDESHINGFHKDFILPIELTELSIGIFKEFSHTFISKYRKKITFSSAREDVCIFNQSFSHVNLFCDFRKKIFYIKIGGKNIFIKYIHELQNLYLSLTKEELTFN